MPDLPAVLFVCVHNAGRSQMAAAFCAHLGRGRVRVRSAGSAPANAVSPTVIEAMAEVGMDLTEREHGESKAFRLKNAVDVARTISLLFRLEWGLASE